MWRSDAAVWATLMMTYGEGVKPAAKPGVTKKNFPALGGLTWPVVNRPRLRFAVLA